MTHRLLALAEQLDGAVLQRVFTHTSWAAARGESYERLEFLGDSVLSLCITTELYRRFPDLPEGHLARLRAYVVSRATCTRVATRLRLGRQLRERAGENKEGGEAVQLETNDNVLADLTEALIGAVYLTFGYETVRPAVVEVFNEHINFAVNSYVDYKTELQEQLARDGRKVRYGVLSSKGPAHDREFRVEAHVGDETLGSGIGSSKKRAEQNAAREALHKLQAETRPETRATPQGRQSVALGAH